VPAARLSASGSASRSSSSSWRTASSSPLATAAIAVVDAVAPVASSLAVAVARVAVAVVRVVDAVPPVAVPVVTSVAAVAVPVAAALLPSTPTTSLLSLAWEARWLQPHHHNAKWASTALALFPGRPPIIQQNAESKWRRFARIGRRLRGLDRMSMV